MSHCGRHVRRRNHPRENSVVWTWFIAAAIALAGDTPAHANRVAASVTASTYRLRGRDRHKQPHNEDANHSLNHSEAGSHGGGNSLSKARRNPEWYATNHPKWEESAIATKQNNNGEGNGSRYASIDLDSKTNKIERKVLEKETLPPGCDIECFFDKHFVRHTDEMEYTREAALKHIREHNIKVTQHSCLCLGKIHNVGDSKPLKPIEAALPPGCDLDCFFHNHYWLEHKIEHTEEAVLNLIRDHKLRVNKTSCRCNDKKPVEGNSSETKPEVTLPPGCNLDCFFENHPWYARTLPHTEEAVLHHFQEVKRPIKINACQCAAAADGANEGGGAESSKVENEVLEAVQEEPIKDDFDNDGDSGGDDDDDDDDFDIDNGNDVDNSEVDGNDADDNGGTESTKVENEVLEEPIKGDFGNDNGNTEDLDEDELHNHGNLFSNTNAAGDNDDEESTNVENEVPEAAEEKAAGIDDKVFVTTSQPTLDKSSSFTVPPELSEMASGEIENTKTKSAAFGVVSLCFAFLILVGGTYAAVTCQARKKTREREALMDVANLHNFENQRKSPRAHRQSLWSKRRRSSFIDEFRSINDNIGVDLRNSATGGWHGIYNDNQLETINFSGSDSSDKGGKGVVSSEQGHGVQNGDTDLLLQDMTSTGLVSSDGINKGEPPERLSSIERQAELEEIEASASQIEASDDNYVIGDMDAGVSDEDLIKAYNDALALSIEPENQDDGFMMQGFGPDKTIT